MRRREFITLLGGAAVAWPLGPHAQRTVKLGFFSPNRASAQMQMDHAFLHRLRKLGWSEERTVAIEYLGRMDGLKACLRFLPSWPDSLLLHPAREYC